MKENLFKEVRLDKNNPKWNNAIKRNGKLYLRALDIRSDFYRDYGRLLHCQEYRRLKHKTQVFFAPKNDHICTRMEHVNHVSSVSYTISKHLGLNTELTSAIAIGHDIGHAPFGHEGEAILFKIADNNGFSFWHERNGMYVCDNISTLPDVDGKERNLHLTYAVRDGIISHCGEVDENAIFPREEGIDLCSINKANQYNPYTWEGCVVKISDKIAYLGRDIEDAITLRILNKKQLLELRSIVKRILNKSTLNNTVLMHDLITDLCKNSSPDKGLVLSPRHLELINSIKEYNYRHIYNSQRLAYYKEYSNLIINTLYKFLCDIYAGEKTAERLLKRRTLYPNLVMSFRSWLIKYTDIDKRAKQRHKCYNKSIYDINNEMDYKRAIVDFIAGMTDNFAIKMYHEIISF